MNSSNGALSFEAILENRQLLQQIAASEKRLTAFSTKALDSLSEVEDGFKSLGAAAASYLSFTSLGSFTKDLISIRGEFANLEIAFTTMLGSKAKADQLMKDVVKFAGTTPFDLQGVASASKQLLAYGFASEEVIERLRRLGDISAGLNIPLGELTELYGKTRTNGRLFAEDLNQYVGRGIPLIKLLADQFKVAEADVRGLVEQGRVGFPEVEQAIIKLTDAGGMFSGLMAEQSKTIAGLYANFEDAVTRAFNNVGKEQEGLLSEVIQFGTMAVESYEPIMDALTVLIATYGSYKAAVIATAAVQAVAANAGAISAWFSLAKSIKSAGDAMALFNLTTAASPIGIAAAAITGLVLATSLFTEETTEATKAQERANAITEKFNQTKAEESSKVQILTQQIKDESRSREDRNKKLQELIALSPQHFNALTLDNIATQKGTDAIRDYTKALEHKLKVQATEERIVGNNKRIQDIRSGVVNDEFEPGSFERVKLFFEDSGFDEKKFKNETEKRKKAAIKAMEDENKELIKIAAEGETQRTKITATTPPVKKEKAQEAAKQEKDVRVKTFAEELEEKKQMYALYQRWVENFGQKAADEQFKDLISKNKDYIAYLNAKQEEIESAKYYRGFNTDDAKNVDLIITERTEAKGGKSAIDQFKDKLVAAREEAVSLTEHLVYLKNEQDKLNSTAPTNTVAAQKQAVAEAINATRKQLKDELNQYLQNVAGSESKRLEIQAHYAELRKGLEERFNGEKTDEYNRALAQMASDEEREFQEQKDRIHEQSAEFKALSKVISETGRDGIKIRIGREEAELENIAKIYGKNSNEYAAQVEKIKQLNKDLADEGIKNFNSWALMVGILAESLSEVPGAIGKIGSALGGLSSGLANFSKAMERTKDGKVSMEGYGAAVQGVTQIIGIITSSAQQRKEAERQYYQSVIAQQTEYNLLLNEQIGLQADATKSVFYTDFDKVISSGIAKMQDAQENFEKSLSDLANGKAKNGQKNGIDWKAVGAGAAAGAGVGAVAGAGVFSWAGAAIGAAAGAIAGLIGGLKKKDKFTPLLQAWPGLIDESKEGVDKFNVALAQTLIQNNLVDDATKQILQTTIDWTEQLKEAQEQIRGVISDLAGALGDTLRDGLVNAFEEGASAAEAFGDSVNKILENLLEQMIFSKVLGPALDQLEKDMNESVGVGGDQDWMDDFGRFFAKGQTLGEQFFKGMEDAQKSGAAYGFDLWAKENGGKAPSPMQGTISGMTQEQAGVLEGQFNAMRISIAESNAIFRNQLIELSGIRMNTGNTDVNTRELYAMRRALDNIERVLSSDVFRAV
ncbi:MAG TPA: tape measure protein, partial [Dyadobacter sp.]|nr:tape measure protein [Dyadobacter sp.]